MRPLPDLTPLDQQPSVFDQPADDFNLAFADEFAAANSQQALLDQTTPGVYAAMDPISSAIDDLSTALDAAGSVLDLLSGDLDAVNLDPEILNYQALDTSLDSNLANPVFDFTDAAFSLLDAIGNISSYLIGEALIPINELLSFLQEEDYYFNSVIAGLAQGSPGGVA